MVTANVLCNYLPSKRSNLVRECDNYSSIALNPVLYGLHNKRIRKVLTRRFVGYFKERYHINNFTFVSRMTLNELQSKEQCSFVNHVNTPP